MSETPPTSDSVAPVSPVAKPVAERPLAPRHPKYDAIHRAVLSGMLGNVGMRGEQHEYLGTRGGKFSIFPGSALFKKNPRWVVAGELVETSRLYARTVAQVHPAWIERVAGHLLEREYSEVHWQRDTAHVGAWEKVSLYGLVLVPRRSVHYGSIDPVVSREVFMEHALVRGEFRTAGGFLRHNLELVRQVEALGAKGRRHDLLKDAGSRYQFYDARVPAGITNGPLFERWRREAEAKDARVLFMERGVVMDESAEGWRSITPANYPDELVVNETRLAVRYKFAPGEVDDGVTVTVPVAVVNQVREERFEWLVPGLLREKVVELIKTLPGGLRRNFVPAPAYADEVLKRVGAGMAAGLTEAVARELGVITGVTVAAEEFRPETLADHLRMNFRILDDDGRVIATGRNLAAIKRNVAQRARESFANLQQTAFNREKVTGWDFGDLPERVELRRGGMKLVGYPALVDERTRVSMRLLQSPEAAAESMRAGLRRLFAIQYRADLRYLEKSLPGLDRMALLFSTLGPTQLLVGDLLDASVDRACFGDNVEVVRTGAAFRERMESGRLRLFDAANEVCALASAILERYHVDAVKLEEASPMRWTEATEDIREQMGYLLQRRFMTNTPWAWLGHVPRYLRAVEVRLRKLAAGGAARDAELAGEVAPFWIAYLNRAARHREQQVIDPELELYRWMVEEFRVQLFAQEVGLATPVSAKRLEKQWERVRG